MSENFALERDEMVMRQLLPRGILSSDVLDAMRSVPRHLFVPENLRSSAYDDSPLPIGLGQTISQPYIVAYMTEQLPSARGFSGMKVLEIGTGSGYQAAILASLGCEVFTIEFVKEHADNARRVLADCGYENVVVRHGNGFTGLPDEAPFDAVIVTAAPEYIPPALIEQLKDGGKMIIPVGEVHAVQALKLLTKRGNGCVEDDLMLVRFVPMVDG